MRCLKDICDTYPQSKADWALHQNIHYMRGFHQGVEFMLAHGLNFQSEETRNRLRDLLLSLREKSKRGERIGFVFQELEVYLWLVRNEKGSR